MIEFEITGFRKCEIPIIVPKDATRDEIIDLFLEMSEKSQLWDEVGYIQEDDGLVVIWRTEYRDDTSVSSYPAYLRFVA